jgi:hypothetical protein
MDTCAIIRPIHASWLSTRYSWLWLILIVATYAAFSTHSGLSPHGDETATSCAMFLFGFAVIVWLGRYKEERAERRAWLEHIKLRAELDETRDVEHMGRYIYDSDFPVHSSATCQIWKARIAGDKTTKVAVKVMNDA